MTKMHNILFPWTNIIITVKDLGTVYYKITFLHDEEITKKFEWDSTQLNLDLIWSPPTFRTWRDVDVCVWGGGGGGALSYQSTLLFTCPFLPWGRGFLITKSYPLGWKAGHWQ